MGESRRRGYVCKGKFVYLHFFAYSHVARSCLQCVFGATDRARKHLFVLREAVATGQSGYSEAECGAFGSGSGREVILKDSFGKKGGNHPEREREMYFILFFLNQRDLLLLKKYFISLESRICTVSLTDRYSSTKQFRI